MSLEARLQRIERRMRPRQGITFIPVGIAGTDVEAAFLERERRRLGLRSAAELLAFRWGEVQA